MPISAAVSRSSWTICWEPVLYIAFLVTLNLKLFYGFFIYEYFSPFFSNQDSSLLSSSTVFDISEFLSSAVRSYNRIFRSWSLLVSFWARSSWSGAGISLFIVRVLFYYLLIIRRPVGFYIDSVKSAALVGELGSCNSWGLWLPWSLLLWKVSSNSSSSWISMVGTLLTSDLETLLWFFKLCEADVFFIFGLSSVDFESLLYFEKSGEYDLLILIFGFGDFDI